MPRFSDSSGTIAATGVSQQAAPSNPNRKYLLFQNLAANDMYVNFGAPARTVAGSVKVAAGATFVVDVCCPDEQVTVVGTAGDSYTCKDGV